MTTRKAIIIDDEPYARYDLRYLLDAHPEIEIIGEASSIVESLELLHQVKPDIVFLDIHLRGGSGLDLLPIIPAASDVVFFTACDKFPEELPSSQKANLLLKPVSPERLAQSLQKLKRPNL